jgi:alpha-tubulin suppressor-like RCC1 family protein
MHFHNQGGTITLNNNTVIGGDGTNLGTNKGILASGGGAAWTITNNAVSGTQGEGPQMGVGVSGLSAQGSLTMSGNTISGVGGVGMGIKDNLANAVLSANSVSDTWSNSGGSQLAQVGLGIALIDSTAISLTDNAVSNSAFAGVLIDLAGWDAANGAPTIALTDTTTNGNGGETSRDIVQQNIPDDAQVTVTSSGTEETRTEDQVAVDRSQTPPPRCGDGVVDPGETCDPPIAGSDPTCSDGCDRIVGFVGLAASDSQLCAVDTTDTIHCLGADSGMMAGLFGSEVSGALPELRPLQLGPNNPRRPYAQVAVGSRHSCALTQVTQDQPSAQVYCWGSNQEGQLGTLGLGASDPVPVSIPLAGDGEANPVVAIYAAQTHSCARRLEGQLYCWGTNDQGALGLGGSGNAATSATEPTQVQAINNQEFRVQAFWTGAGASCARVQAIQAPPSSHYVCWGRSEIINPALANQQGGFEYQPDLERGIIETGAAEPMEAGAHVAIGIDHICLSDVLGVLYCFGNSSGWQLGNGVDSGSFTATSPAKPLFDHNGQTRQPFGVQTLATNGSLTCAGLEDSSLWCWGQNNYGLIVPAPENGTHLGMGRRLDVLGNLDLYSLSLSPGRACAVVSGNSSTRQLACWGDDRFVRSAGAVPTLGFQPPQRIDLADEIAPNPPEFKSVRMGGVSQTFGAAIGQTTGLNQATERQIFVWGSIDNPQTPDLDPAQFNFAHLPQILSGYTNVRQAVPMGDGLCFVHASAEVLRDGVFCIGQLGLNNEELGTPLLARSEGIPLTSMTRLWCGESHCCGINPDSSEQAYCWGSNDYGQAGLDPINGVSIGVQDVAEIQAPASYTFVNMALGREHTCAAVQNGFQGDESPAVICWGRNNRQQFGVAGSTTNEAYSAYPWFDLGLYVYQPGNPRTMVYAHDLGAGAEHTCAADRAGDLRCWGQGEFGQLGNSLYNYRFDQMLGDIEPIALENNMRALSSERRSTYQTIAGDAGSTCYITQEHRVACLGDNASGVVSSDQRLAQTNEDRVRSATRNHAPRLVPNWPESFDNDDAIELSLHNGSGCALHRSGSIVCWGSNASGAMGRAHNLKVYAPQPQP